MNIISSPKRAEHEEVTMTCDSCTTIFTATTEEISLTLSGQLWSDYYDSIFDVTISCACPFCYREVNKRTHSMETLTCVPEHRRTYITSSFLRQKISTKAAFLRKYEKSLPQRETFLIKMGAYCE